MRYVGIVLVLLSLPALWMWLRGNQKNLRYAYFGIGILPFVSGPLNLDAALWHIGGLGYAKGLVLNLLDTLCLAILATSRTRILRLPFTGLFAGYIVASFLSVFQAPGFFAPFSYTFQLLRAFIVFAAVATVVQRPGALTYIANGLAVGAIIQAVATIIQRLGGDLQAGGTIGHQNLTGMVLHFSTLPLLAMLLAGNTSKLYLAGLGGGFIALGLGASRGSIAALTIGLIVLLLCSVIRKATARKFGVIGVLVLMLVAASPLLYGGLAARFSDVSQITSSDGEREAFERAASAMFADHPLGVGANRYTFVGITEGYSERAGVTWAGASRTAVVHNLFYLTAAELGWFGLLTLIPLLAWVLLRGFHFAFSRRHDPSGDIVLGCTCAVLAVVAQSFYEWVFVMTTMNYMFAIAMGIIAGTIVQRKAEARRMARKPAVGQISEPSAAARPAHASSSTAA